MAIAYDIHYRTENLFGEPYPELIHFFSNLPSRGKLLDLGCGQGRNAIPLTRLGFEVTGIDNSEVGIEQMLKTAKAEKLQVMGMIGDMYEFTDFGRFDYMLLDSMFHFRKSELKQESELVKRVIQHSKRGALIVFCIQDSGTKIQTFNGILRGLAFNQIESELDFTYTFEDPKHVSATKYMMIVIRK